MQPLGVIRITAQSAHIYPWSPLVGRKPQAFLTISTKWKQNVARTKCIHRSFEPTWMETMHIVVHALDEFLELSLYNHHEYRSSALIGSIRFPLPSIIDRGELTSFNFNVCKGEKGTDVLADMAYYPIVSKYDGSSATVVISCIIHGAAELDITESQQDVYVQARLGSGDPPIHTTHVSKESRSPAWNSAFDFFCTHLPSTTMNIEVNGESHSNTLGYLSLSLEDMLDRSEAGVEWWPLNGCQSGRIRLSIKGWVVNKLFNG